MKATQTLKRIGGAVLFGSLVFLIVLLIGGSRLHVPAWLMVAGRMHPLFLHFPIVLLLISFIVLWLPLEDQEENEWLVLLRLSAALTAVITAIMGLLLSMENDKAGNMLQWHKWGGVSLAVAGSFFYFYYPLFVRLRAPGKLFTTLATVLLLVTSHWGGDLTHGENFLLGPLDQRKPVSLQQAVAFDDVIRPLLEKKCFSCHGGSVSKGGLFLQTMAGLAKGGKTGPGFVPGSPEVSLLIQRIHLPMEEKKHMPPAAKPQLTVEETALLYAWIKAGAPADKKLISLPLQDSFRLLASGLLAAEEDAAEEEPVYDFKAADEKKIAALNTNYRVIEPQGIHSPALSVHFYGKGMYSAKVLEELLPLKEQIIELSLARMPVKDEQLKIVGQFRNLQILNLDYSDVTAGGLGSLAGLKSLQRLYLSGTAVNAEGLEKVAGLPRLTTLVIWNTPADSATVAALGRKHGNLHIERGFIDNGQLVVALSPPVVQTPAGVFDSSIWVDIRHPFKGVEIRYTLDGSRPDSSTSAIYNGPVRIGSDAKLVARAFKKGWEGSVAARSMYVKRGFKPDSVEMISPPDSQYRAGGSKILSDAVLGDFNFGDGGYLGYRKNEASWYLYFDTVASVHSVMLNMLENTGSYIFPPAVVEAWGGMDKRHLKLLGRMTPGMPVRDTTALLQETIGFSLTRVKCLKIIARPVPKNPIKPVPLTPLEKAAKLKEEKLAAEKLAAEKLAEAKLNAGKTGKEKLASAEKPKEDKSKKQKPSKPEPGWIMISELVLN